MVTRFMRCLVGLVVLVSLLAATEIRAASFKVGYAQCDITPAKPTPMWGYGDRHHALSKGVQDPLMARAIVLDVGSQKLAIVGTDLGRAPRQDMMDRIRKAVQSDAGVGLVMIAGSHTHSGPVLELRDKPGEGKGVYDDAIAYVVELEKKIIGVIREAAGNAQEARIGWGSADIDMNRNRHTKMEPKPTDPELSVLRFDNAEGKPIAILVNYAAHPTMLDSMDLKFSSEYPGQMIKEIQRVSNVPCVFMQGAAGDMSAKRTPETDSIEAYGKALAKHVLDIMQGIETRVPEKPSIQGMDEDFTFEMRVDIRNPVLQALFKIGFFPEFAQAYLNNEVKDNVIHPHLTTVLVNGELALVGASGEFFCEHATRLKARCRAGKTLFFGYCNGHDMYFPTIEAAAEGGYGGDAKMSWAAVGAGELMMNTALVNLYTMMGKYKLEIPGL